MHGNDDSVILLAQEYENIAAKIDPRLVQVANVKWQGRVSDEDRKKAEALANNWASIHKGFKPLDFVSTLHGAEEQFKR